VIKIEGALSALQYFIDTENTEAENIVEMLLIDGTIVINGGTIGWQVGERLKLHGTPTKGNNLYESEQWDIEKTYIVNIKKEYNKFSNSLIYYALVGAGTKGLFSDVYINRCKESEKIIIYSRKYSFPDLCMFLNENGIVYSGGRG
jgi:hypothetical protein